MMVKKPFPPAAVTPRETFWQPVDGRGPVAMVIS
jgi:hypothetical protein